jgi:two-component system chemotaxis response regulator CheB
MVVDDSLVIRGIISRIVRSDATLEVVASANNGQVAVERARKGDIDVVILDIEMPEMDGLTALPLLLAIDPRLIVIMASTLTLRNADISIRALNAGAADYIPKPTATTEIGGASAFAAELLQKIRVLGSRRVARAQRGATGQPQASLPISLRTPSPLPPQVLAIGSSTGGPQALMRLVAALRAGPKVPTLITQHMPPKFTAFLADHLARESGLVCREAQSGDLLRAGEVLVAPGDYHMLVERRGTDVTVVLSQGPKENFCRPSVDPMLRSVVQIFGAHTLAVILTGMGSDGLEGARAVVDAGGTVLAQDEATSVVWGMPGVVARAGLCTSVLPLPGLARRIADFVGCVTP